MVTIKWKWLFVSGCEYNSLSSTATKFLNPCQFGTWVTLCPGDQVDKQRYCSAVN